jgi:hypothetical protein
MLLLVGLQVIVTAPAVTPVVLVPKLHSPSTGGTVSSASCVGQVPDENKGRGK